jgi:NADPH-dependent ferric siderophore reductase
LLADKVLSLPWLEGRGFIWSACEMNSMRPLRQYFLRENMVTKDQIYISSYWKIGVSDEGHKLAKKQEANPE